MRFMIIRKADKDTEASTMPEEGLLAAMTQYNEEMMKAGVLRGGEGLHPSAKGARIKFSGGKPNVIDGPFAETKELVAGYTLIEVASREEALAWVKRWPALDGGGEVELELRQIFEAADFGEAFTPELQKREDDMRAQLEGGGAGTTPKP
ncbi:YciI family protein [Chondromyces apiculatus]|uniref:PhnB protein n=1 Tax=Chondromyces apiculatus DSM 436 TaxID=1192034 RepID=A0A017THW3_9BACT|nr:YciI family protein [Chondromyces apiculatus]EYF08425.1 PhnB protein [Chondromyces apiculatus DSM 436]